MRKLADQIAGSRARRFALPKAERDMIWKTAQSLADLGANIGRADSAEREGRKSGFVYVIDHPSWPGYVKIGRAFDPEGRLASFQTGCPNRAYRLRAAVYFQDAHFAENEMHQRLARFRVQGEWFRFTWPEARLALNELREVI